MTHDNGKDVILKTIAAIKALGEKPKSKDEEEKREDEHNRAAVNPKNPPVDGLESNEEQEATEGQEAAADAREEDPYGDRVDDQKDQFKRRTKKK